MPKMEKGKEAENGQQMELRRNEGRMIGTVRMKRMAEMTTLRMPNEMVIKMMTVICKVERTAIRTMEMARGKGIQRFRIRKLAGKRIRKTMMRRCRTQRGKQHKKLAGKGIRKTTTRRCRTQRGKQHKKLARKGIQKTTTRRCRTQKGKQHKK